MTDPPSRIGRTQSGGVPLVSSLDDAYSWCLKFAKSHYENFPVVSVLLTKQEQRALAAVYAIARIGDDIADEPFTGDRLEALATLDAVVDNRIEPGGNPAYMAIQDTINKFRLPTDPFHRLFMAFRFDAENTASGTAQPPTIRFNTWEEVHQYCNSSANPVGELYLRIHGQWSDAVKPMSDALCTALQITNFLQDLSVDVPRGRLYIPGLPNNPLQDLVQTQRALDDAKNHTARLYTAARTLYQVVHPLRLRLTLRTIALGGRIILARCNISSLTKRVKHP